MMLAVIFRTLAGMLSIPVYFEANSLLRRSVTQLTEIVLKFVIFLFLRRELMRDQLPFTSFDWERSLIFPIK